MGRLPPYCENCGQYVAKQKSIKLDDASFRLIIKARWLCRSSFRKLPHLSAKGIQEFNAALDRLQKGC